MSDSESRLEGSSIAAPELRVVAEMEDLPDQLLSWIASSCREVRVEAGEKLFCHDEEARYMILVLEGDLEVLGEVAGQRRLMRVWHAGGIAGILPFSRMTRYGVDLIAASPVRAALFSKEHFPELVRRSPQLAERLVHFMSARVRKLTQIQLQHEKLAALGKLSAGLAHELNNPAAAIRRTVLELRRRLSGLPRQVEEMACDGVDAQQIREACRLSRESSAKAERKPLSALERSEREDEIGDWLEDAGLDEGWQLAEAFVEAGLQLEDLETLSQERGGKGLNGLLAWLEATLASQRLLDEIASASERISQLVEAVREHTYPERAQEKRETDVNRGLDSTLVVLGHKIRKKDAKIVRSYDPQLPPIRAFPGLLNQVWTNLIDNALDAVADGGEVRLESAREGDWVTVRVIDDGPGISPEDQRRIFEPWYTTKAPGQGTGLGLDIVRGIVTDQSAGKLELSSRPGRTEFTVRLPIE